MSETNKFEFIPDIPKELLPEILNGNVIVFVGNGVSRLAGIPSWKELAHMYLEDWREDENTDLSYDVYEKLKREKIDPLELLTICAGKLGKKKIKEQLFAKLNGSLSEKSKEKIQRIYGYIRDFNAGYITTNYDSYLEMSNPQNSMLSEGNSKPNVDVSKRLTRVELNDNLESIEDKIVYLHGKAEDPNSPEKNGIRNDIILTLEDYLGHYKDNGGLGKEFLGKILGTIFFYLLDLG